MCPQVAAKEVFALKKFCERHFHMFLTCQLLTFTVFIFWYLLGFFVFLRENILSYK